MDNLTDFETLCAIKIVRISNFTENYAQMVLIDYLAWILLILTSVHTIHHID